MIGRKANEKNRKFDKYLKKTINILTLTVPFIFIFYFWRLNKNAEQYEMSKRNIEFKLNFKGTISKYKTDIGAEKSTFILDDSILITIPRNSKELYLNDGDEITKIKGNNIYIVKRDILWNNESKKTIDTFNFN